MTWVSDKNKTIGFWFRSGCRFFLFIKNWQNVEWREVGKWNELSCYQGIVEDFCPEHVPHAGRDGTSQQRGCRAEFWASGKVRIRKWVFCFKKWCAKVNRVVVNVGTASYWGWGYFFHHLFTLSFMLSRLLYHYSIYLVFWDVPSHFEMDFLSNLE